MRRSFAALHVVALGLWLGALAFSFLLAKTLFERAVPVCPACQKVRNVDSPSVRCVTCGALHHSACASRGCGLEHAGGHELRSGDVSAVATTSLGVFARVKVGDDKVAPERRLLWMLTATSGAQRPDKGEVPGACFELPREGVGDALARAFDLSQAISIAMAAVALLTVLLVPPGGALRFIRGGLLLGAFALAVYGLGAAHGVAEKRLLLETPEGPTQVVRDDFNRSHGMSFAANLAEGVLVLVAFALAGERKVPAGNG